MYLYQLYVNIDLTGQSRQREFCILTHDTKTNDERKNKEKSLSKHKEIKSCESLSFPHNSNIKSAYTYIYKKTIRSKTN